MTGATEKRVFPLALPGDTIQGTLGQDNLIELQTTRNIYLCFDDDGGGKYRIHAKRPNNEADRFYIQQEGRQFEEYCFGSHQDVDLRLAKGFDGILYIERKSKEGWVNHSSLPIAALDGNAYTEKLDIPAPFMVLSKTIKSSTQDEAPPTAYKYQEGGSRTPANPSFINSSKQVQVPQRMLLADYEKLMQKSEQIACTPVHEPFVSASPYSLPTDETANCHAALPGRWMQTAIAHEVASMNPEEEHVLVAEIDEELFNKTVESIEPGRRYLFGASTPQVLLDLVSILFVEISVKGQFLRDLRGANIRLKTSIGANGRKIYVVIISGHSGLRNLVTASRYTIGPHRNAVTPVFAGFGSVSDAIRAGGQNVGSIFKLNTFVGKVFYFSLAVDTYYWFQEGSKDVSKLLVTWLETTIGGAAIAVIAPIAMLVMRAFMVPSGIATVPVWLVIIGGIVITVGSGVGIAWIVREASQWLEEIAEGNRRETGSWTGVDWDAAHNQN